MSFANQSRGTLGRGKDAPGKSRESGLSPRPWKTRIERGFPTFPPPRRRALEEAMKSAEQKPLDAAAPFIDAPAREVNRNDSEKIKWTKLPHAGSIYMGHRYDGSKVFDNLLLSLLNDASHGVLKARS